jgi:hypothetical protein
MEGNKMTKRKYPTQKHIMEVTDFKTKEKVKAALEALKWLEAGAPEKLDGLDGKFYFNMVNFINGTSCGTNCCIAGAMYSHMNSLNGDNKDQYLGADFLECTFGHYDAYSYGWKLPLELDKLFFSHMNTLTTPAQGAKALRSYLETGITNWD